MPKSSLLWLLLTLCGAVAGWTLAGVGLPSAELGLRTEPFRLVRKASDPYPLDASRWLFEPHRYGDFDLKATVELGEATTLDWLVRQVEPRIVGSALQPFHGRFTVLRLSTSASGPAWLSREDALLGDLARGHRVAPGMAATVWIQARGRTLRANIAGQWLPPIEADDHYGMLTLLVRGGKVVVQDLVIEPREPELGWLRLRWPWAAFGAALGLLVVALASRLGGKRFPIAYAGLVLGVAGPFLAGRLQAPPLALVEHGGVAQCLVGLGLAALFVALPGSKNLVLLLGKLLLCFGGAVVLLTHGSLAIEQPRVVPASQQDELDALFGPAAGNSLAEALGQRVRGPLRVHTRAGPEPAVFLLGGQLLYGSRRAEEPESLEPYLMGALQRELGERWVAPTLPTADGHSQQQWALFERFYAGYAPRALVFGVPSDEAAVEPRTGAPRSSPQRLRDTLGAARRHAAANGTALVLFALSDLPAELRAVLDETAREGVPFVQVAPGELPSTVADQLAAALTPLLKR